MVGDSQIGLMKGSEFQIATAENSTVHIPWLTSTLGKNILCSEKLVVLKIARQVASIGLMVTSFLRRR